MNSYPDKLMETVLPLPDDMNQPHLSGLGLHVVQGLDLNLAEQLVERSKEPHIAEYCPNDPVKRFSGLEAVVAWQAKGRLALPLVRSAGDKALRLVGFGWTGPQVPSEGEPDIPTARTTFAIRLYEDALGQRNALPYTMAILAANDSLYGNEGLWLESWGDNSAALKTYGRAGFEKVAEVQCDRSGHPVTRVYMLMNPFQNSLSPAKSLDVGAKPAKREEE